MFFFWQATKKPGKWQSEVQVFTCQEWGDWHRHEPAPQPAGRLATKNTALPSRYENMVTDPSVPGHWGLTFVETQILLTQVDP